MLCDLVFKLHSSQLRVLAPGFCILSPGFRVLNLGFKSWVIVNEYALKSLAFQGSNLNGVDQTIVRIRAFWLFSINKNVLQNELDLVGNICYITLKVGYINYHLSFNLRQSIHRKHLIFWQQRYINMLIILIMNSCGFSLYKKINHTFSEKGNIWTCTQKIHSGMVYADFVSADLFLFTKVIEKYSSNWNYWTRKHLISTFVS